MDIKAEELLAKLQQHKPLPQAQDRAAFINQDARQPGFEIFRPAQRIQVLPRAQDSLLRCVRAVLLAAEHGLCDAV